MEIVLEYSRARPKDRIVSGLFQRRVPIVLACAHMAGGFKDRRRHFKFAVLLTSEHFAARTTKHALFSGRFANWAYRHRLPWRQGMPIRVGGSLRLRRKGR